MLLFLASDIGPYISNSSGRVILLLFSLQTGSQRPILFSHCDATIIDATKIASWAKFLPRIWLLYVACKFPDIKKQDVLGFYHFHETSEVYSKKRSLCRKRLGSELWELRVGGSAASRDQEKTQLLTDAGHPDSSSRQQQMLSFRQVKLSIQQNLFDLKTTIHRCRF